MKTTRFIPLMLGLILAVACEKDDAPEPDPSNPATGDPTPVGGVDVNVDPNEMLLASETDAFKSVWDKPSEPTGNGVTTLLRLSGQDGTTFDLIFEGDNIDAGTYKIADAENTLVPASDEVLVLAGKGALTPLIPSNPGSESLSVSIDSEGKFDVKMAEINFRNQFSWQTAFDDVASFHGQFNLSKNTIDGVAQEATDWTPVEFTAPSNFWVTTVAISSPIATGANLSFNFVGNNFATDNVASTTTNMSDQGLAAAFSGQVGAYLSYVADGKTFDVADANQPVTYEVTADLITVELNGVTVANIQDATDTRTLSTTIHIYK